MGSFREIDMTLTVDPSIENGVFATLCCIYYMNKKVEKDLKRKSGGEGVNMDDSF